MKLVWIAFTLLITTLGDAHAATLNFVFTAQQLLDGIDVSTDAACGNPESQGCAFYAFEVTPVGGGTIFGGSSTAPDYAGLMFPPALIWSDNGLDGVVAFLTRHGTALTGNFNALIGQPGTVTAGANVLETAKFTVSLDNPGLQAGQVLTWNFIAHGVVLNNGQEGTGKPVVGFQLSGEAQSVVPEPGTFVIAGLGLLTVVGARCRSRRA